MKYPIVKKIVDNVRGLNDFEEETNTVLSKRDKEILLEFPTVYIHNWKNTKNYEVYVGETNDILRRTREHYAEGKRQGGWRKKMLRSRASLYIIGHEHFNKSMTLDIENRLMMYLMSVECIRKIHNRRGNAQGKYYPVDETDNIFHCIWQKLRSDNEEVFPSEERIKDSALFKASPLHRLTDEQLKVKEDIIRKVFEAIHKNKSHQLIFIEGEAGTGKTVLNSSTFYDIYLQAEKERIDLKCCMIVNHDEQLRVYKQIALKLGLTERYGEVVYKPTRFINSYSENDPIDVAFVDEAHLLLTQGKQSYTGKNQLADIIQRARVTVVMFDENQILTTEQYWEQEQLEYFRNKAKKEKNYFELKNQLRIKASADVIRWIDDFTKKKRLTKIPKEKGGYQIKIFDGPHEMEQAIKNKAGNEGHELSRIIATYDWSYNSKKRSPNTKTKYWEVSIDKWHKPWNYELERNLGREERKRNRILAWAEQRQTIDEVGSTFTIQGFDLNYAGVILGPSVKYRNGKIIFDPAESRNQKAVQSRTLSDGTKRKFGKLLIQHEVRILMTRGVEGLYIYACDPELRKALKEAEA